MINFNPFICIIQQDLVRKVNRKLEKRKTFDLMSLIGFYAAVLWCFVIMNDMEWKKYNYSKEFIPKMSEVMVE